MQYDRHEKYKRFILHILDCVKFPSAAAVHITGPEGGLVSVIVYNRFTLYSVVKLGFFPVKVLSDGTTLFEGYQSKHS